MSGQDGKAEMLLRHAIHEAGHAVARWALKRTHPRLVPPLMYVVISPDGESGECYADRCQSWLPRPGECSPSVRRRLCADIVIVMAGPIAEALHEGHPRLDNWGDWMDEAKATAHTSAGGCGQRSFGRCLLVGRFSATGRRRRQWRPERRRRRAAVEARQAGLGFVLEATGPGCTHLSPTRSAR